MVMIILMRELNISGLDLNLVPALDALLRRRNVTHAAAEVGMSQPAMSRALARLRDLHGDPLLVRVRGGYALTPRALAIQPQLAQAITHLRAAFQPQGFDAATQRRTVRLVATDGHTVLLLPAVMARLAVEAPGVDVQAEAYRPDILERIESGDLDFAFALSDTPLPPGAYSEVVAHDRLVVVMRRGHPTAGRPWTLADYGVWPQVGVSLVGDGQSQIDSLLAAQGVTRRIALTTPHFMAALAAVAATDMVTTLSAGLAARFADALDLMLKDPPFGDTALKITLVCSNVRASDPFLVWFRALVRDVANA